MVGRREGEGETTAFGYGWYSLFVGVAKPKPEAEPGRAGTAYIKLGHAALSLLGTTIAYDLTYSGNDLGSGQQARERERVHCSRWAVKNGTVAGNSTVPGRRFLDTAADSLS